MKDKNAIAIFLAILGVITIVIITALNINATTVSTEEITETIPYDTVTVYDDTIREGVIEVRKEGENGSKNIIYKIIRKKDGTEVNREVQSEEILVKPVNKEVVEGTKKYYKCSNGIEYESTNEKDECEKRVAWEKQRDISLQECYADSEKFNCWYDEYPGTTLHWNYYTHNDATTTPETRTGAVCKDGWRSSATGRGACSHHGGVLYWI